MNLVICLIVALLVFSTANNHNIKRSNFKYDALRTSFPKPTKTMCMDLANTLRARHKVCFLRPDTGPCRADIVQWYYDVKQRKCYRFFWGGCQGNGNKFETQRECLDHCYLNNTVPKPEIPFFCSLTFDFGSCYGHYYRWGWDTISKTCKRRLYSGCGGNQNNFETEQECINTCIVPPSNTLLKNQHKHQTTCVPLDINDLI